MGEIFEESDVDTPEQRASRLRELVELWERYRDTGDPVSSAFALADFANHMAHLGWELEYEDEVQKANASIKELSTTTPVEQIESHVLGELKVLGELEEFNTEVTLPSPTVSPVLCSYQVKWSEEDREFVATVTEFPSLSWVASSPVGALQGLVRLVDAAVRGT